MPVQSHTNKRSLGATIAIAIGMAWVAILMVSLPAGKSLAQVTGDDTAHVVVQFADGDTAVRPITWTGTISRVVALQLAGFNVEHNGDSVCSIEGEGCPAMSCFCPDNRWAQAQWAGTAWDESYPPPDVAIGDVIAFRNSPPQTDFSNWGVAGFLPAAQTYVAASDALEWMRSQQQSDGSYDDGFDQVGASVRALISLGAAGYDPAAWGTPSLLSFLTVVSQTETINYATTTAAGAGKLALGAAWSGQTPEDFAGMNLPLSLTTYLSQTTLLHSSGSGDAAWAMLGLHVAGGSIPAQAADFLKDVQNADGGWSWNEWSTDSEIQHTALCVQALLAAGESPTATEIISAMTFIASGKNADGGYGYQVGNDSDANTTAFVLQGLLSVGQRPVGTWCTTQRCRYLFSEQATDGSFSAFGSPSLYATQEVIPALMHRSFNPPATWNYRCSAVYLPLVLKNNSTQ